MNGISAWFAILFFWIPAFTGEDLLNPIGFTFIGDSVQVELLMGGYKRTPRDSLFSTIGKMERSFEASRPSYGQYYLWNSACDKLDREEIRKAVKKERIASLLVACRDQRTKKVVPFPYKKGKRKLELWEIDFFNSLDTIQSKFSKK